MQFLKIIIVISEIVKTRRCACRGDKTVKCFLSVFIQKPRDVCNFVYATAYRAIFVNVPQRIANERRGLENETETQIHKVDRAKRTGDKGKIMWGVEREAMHRTIGNGGCALSLSLARTGISLTRGTQSGM